MLLWFTLLSLLNVFEDDGVSKNYIGIDTLYHDPIIVKEEEVLLGSISDIALHNQTSYMADEQRDAIVTLDTHGVASDFIRRSGRGPLEFERPSIIRVINDLIYVWDSDNLKLIAYHPETGEGHKEWTGLLSKSISDFIIHEDIFYGFTRGGAPGATIIGMDLQNGAEVTRFTTKTEAQILLMRVRGNGGLALDGHNLLYVTPDQPNIKLRNLKSHENHTVAVDIPEFEIPEISNAHQIINAGFEAMDEFFSKSSFVTNIHKLKDFYVVEAQTGRVEFVASDNKDPYQNRYLHLAVFDKNFKQLDLITINESKFFSSPVRSTEGNTIYFLHQDYPSMESLYELTPLEFIGKY